jgi:rhamnulokinase
MSPVERLRDTRALVAIDLGAESCRVSLLRWQSGRPEIRFVHRCGNRAVERGGELRWELDKILRELYRGLEMCASIAEEGIRSIGVDGWAVDYVRLDVDGKPLGDPFCYRDARTKAAETALFERISSKRMRELTGVQIAPLNTVYQHFADSPELQQARWLNLPEYVLYWLGGRPVAELTNASHTQMVGLDGKWSEEIFGSAGWSVAQAPEIVPPGTIVGTLSGGLKEFPTFRETKLIAPCCHDTASAIAAVPDTRKDWAYISSGTWSLVGTLLDSANNSAESCAANFTNLGAAEGRICFHKSVNGMWLLQQCIQEWNVESEKISLASLIEVARSVPEKSFVLDLDDPDLLLPGGMPQRINAQLRGRGLPEFSIAAGDAPELASFLFHSLAARYADVLAQIARITGRAFRRIYIFGGGSQNEFLNELTAKATGLPVVRGGTEGSTIGNFAVQLATLEPEESPKVAYWAGILEETRETPRTPAESEKG